MRLQVGTLAYMQRIRMIRGAVQRRRTDATLWLTSARSFEAKARPAPRPRDSKDAAPVDLATVVLSDVIASVNQSAAQF